MPREPFYYPEPTRYGKPTAAEPGTKEKIRVLARRYHCGLILHHPDDPKDQHVMMSESETYAEIGRELNIKDND